ncbi:MAG: hypothetical protein M1818_004701 [Claussenomyces sp. TS43310]|nr:MAG: hypothetical protein M1818_004701 [Claussenomyces sp. TS43310]
MTDIPNWLRFRGRTPAASAPTTPTSERFHFSEEHQPHETEPEMPRPREALRMSSFLGFARQPTPSSSSATAAADPFAHVRGADLTWHNPSPDQMAETLKVVMMTQNNLDPVPVQYNACILQLLEAYHDLQNSLKERDGSLAELRARHDEVFQELQKLAQQWEEKEVNYKTEMKKLEVMVATGQHGLDLVTLARSRSSLIDGEVQELGEGRSDVLGASREGQTDGPMLLNNELDKDTEISRQLSRQQTANSRGNTTIAPAQAGHSLPAEQRSLATCFEEEQKRISRTDRVSSPRQPFASPSLRDPPSEADSSTSSKSSSHGAFEIYRQSSRNDSLEALVANLSLQHQSRLTTDEKPLPEIPPSPDDEFIAHSMEDTPDVGDRLVPSGHNRDRSAPNHSPNHSRGFSFVPGDDLYGMLHRARLNTHDSRGQEGTNQSRCEDFTDSTADYAGLPKPVLKPGKGTSSSKRKKQSDASCERSDSEKPTRGNSQTSVITAIRDNSGHSSKKNEAHGDSNERKLRIRGYDGSNEAIIAATRAIAGRERGNSVNNSPNALLGQGKPDRPVMVRDKAAQINAMGKD